MVVAAAPTCPPSGSSRGPLVLAVPMVRSIPLYLSHRRTSKTKPMMQSTARKTPSAAWRVEAIVMTCADEVKVAKAAASSVLARSSRSAE